MRRLFLLVSLLAPIACGRSPAVQYDLARDADLAERILPGGIRIVLAPRLVIRRDLRFFRAQEGDEDAATRFEREAFIDWRRRAPRDAVLDLESRGNGEAVCHLNDTEVGRIRLDAGRRRYRLSLVEEAQTRRHNRLLVKMPETAQLHGVVVGPAAESALTTLAAAGSPPLLAATQERGAFTLVQAGPSALRYTLRLPGAARLAFRPLPVGAPARLRVTHTAAGGDERELWNGAPSGKAGKEVSVEIPGEAGSLVQLALHVEGGGAVWAAWQAPRVQGHGAGDGLAAAPRTEREERRADPLRRAMRGLNVLLVVLDAASARHFSCYGYRRATTPEIDRLAAEGVLFERASTSAVFTVSAMASVWTSLQHEQHHHGVRHNAPLPLGPATVAERVSALGVRSAAWVGNPLAGSNYGMHRGFSEFHELYRDAKGRFAGLPRGEDFLPLLARFIEKHSAGPRFLAYVHYLEPHFPYDPKPPFDTLFGGDEPLPRSARRDFGWIRNVVAGNVQATPGELEHLGRLYDGNLAAVDHEVGRLRSVLEASRLWDRTLVILTADHGEALGEHGFLTHGHQLYEEATNIPLIVRWPGGPKAIRIRELVDLLDVGATLLDVFGLAEQGQAPQALQGRSLLPVIAGAPGKPALLSRTMGERPDYSLRDERYKFIHELREGRSQLYDLERDPSEEIDLADSDGLRAEFYRQALYRLLRDLPRGPVEAGQTTAAGEDELRGLRALGYVQ